MPTTRLHVNCLIVVGQSVAVEDDRAKYVGRVLRLRPGDEVVIFNGHGGEYLGRIASLGKRSASIEVTEKIPTTRESPLYVHLLQGVSRGERMDHVVQKTTELGVARITPVLTEYSVVKLTGERAARRVQHWQGVATSACEQSGRNVVPAIDMPSPLRDTLGGFVGQRGTRIVLDPGANDGTPESRPDDDRVVLLIGPEGGFSGEEYELAAAAGFTAAKFGPRILRTETAAVAALAILQSRFGDLA